jgi:hypothetical protein
MGIMRRVLDLLLPRGLIWRFTGEASIMFDGIAESLQRAKEKIDQARYESRPITALDTLPEWHRAMGIAYDPTLPIERQRAMLDAILTATGNATPEGLALQIGKEYAGLTVSETGPLAFAISGTVERVQDARRVGAIISHFAPLHLVPTVFGYTAPTAGNPNPVPPSPDLDDPSIISTNPVARCGVATTGLARIGKAS